MATEDEKQEGKFSSKISDDINCPICLDILVCPRTLVPCGHSFCRSCCFSNSKQNGRNRETLSFTKCPHCRQAIEDTVPSRQLESLIDTLVTVPNLLFSNDDDKQHYLERRNKENERSPVLEVPARTRKRRRRDEFHSQHYATAQHGNTYHGPPNHYYAHHNGGVGFQSSTNYTTVAPAASYDPMVAPLPPPYDFSGTGPVPVLSYRRPINSSTSARSRPPQMPRSTVTTTSTTGTSGVSASDPICID